MLQGDVMQVAFVFELQRRGVTVEFRQDRRGAVALGSVVVAVKDDKPGRRHGDESISDTIHAEKPRGRDVFIVQPTSNPVDQHLMELLVMVDAARRASAARITAVIPYFGFARQDRRPRSARS